MGSLFATKPIKTILAEAEGSGEQHSLKRALGPVNLITLGIGAIIGAGIFVLTGAAAALYAGPAIVLSFILAGVGCVFAGLCYAEFASLIPIAGSAYTYGYATLGEIFAWIIGWDLILEYAFGAATVASGWSGYCVSLLQDFGIHIPPALTATPGIPLVQYGGRWERLTTVLPTLTAHGIDPAALPHTAGVFNIVAFFAIAVVTTVLVIGIRESANVNNAIVMIKVSIVLVFIGVAAVFVTRNPQIATVNWHPFVPPNAGEFGKFGWSGIARGAAVIFFAYIGFDAVSTAAQEAKKPQRDMPIGILGSLVICTILYIAVAGVLTGLVPYSELDVPDPIAKGVDAIGVTWFSILIKLGALTGLTTVILMLLYGQSRIFFTISHDGLLPGIFARVHPKLRTPYLSQLMIGTVVAIVAAFTPINVLGEMVSIGTLFAFVLVCGAVLYLRRSDPHVARPFRAPGSPVIPLLGVLFCLLLMAGLPLVTWGRLIVWLVIGLAIYYAYGRHHSTLRQATA